MRRCTWRELAVAQWRPEGEGRRGAGAAPPRFPETRVQRFRKRRTTIYLFPVGKKYDLLRLGNGGGSYTSCTSRRPSRRIHDTAPDGKARAAVTMQVRCGGGGDQSNHSRTVRPRFFARFLPDAAVGCACGTSRRTASRSASPNFSTRTVPRPRHFRSSVAVRGMQRTTSHRTRFDGASLAQLPSSLTRESRASASALSSAVCARGPKVGQ